jgi:EmrB/QacA subfamily drug resistance transporter
VLLATVLGSGLAGVDATVVNVALPAIGESLNVDFAILQWTITAYTLTLASLILLGGALGDRYGRRRVFVIGVIWFAVASMACGAAPSAGWLIAARALQGVGAALLTPGSLAIIQATFAPRDRARAIGAWSGYGAIATAIGPLVGGWLVLAASWRWVFLINLPLSVIVVIVAMRHIPETRNPAAATRIDLWGAILALVGLAGVTYAIIAIPDNGVSATHVVVPGIVGVLALIGFVIAEARVRHPMLPLSMFASRQFSSANLYTFVVYAAISGVFFLLAVQLQVVSGFSPLAAGMALIPVTIVILLLSARAGALAQRIGPRIPMTTGAAICVVATLLMRTIGPDAQFAKDVLPSVTLFGVGLALLVAPLTATVLAAADTGLAGTASGVNNAVARAAGLMAIAALPVLAGISGDGYTDAGAFNLSYQTGMLYAAALLAAGAVIAVTLISHNLAEEPS